MLSFDTIATRVVVEGYLKDSGISPEYVFSAWLRSRYRQIIDRLQFSDINRQDTIAFATQEPLVQGTVSVTHGSNIINGAGTITTAQQVGHYFRINEKRSWYKIIAVANTTEWTLDTAYTEENASGVAYTIAKRYYVAPTGVRWITDIKLPQRHLLYEVDQSKLDELFPSREASVTIPQYWAPAGFDPATGRRMLEFYPIADAMYRIEIIGFANLDEPTLQSSPIGDINDRVLIEGGLADAMKYRAAAPSLPAAEVQGLLLLYGSHEKQFNVLLQDVLRRSSLDKPQPRVTVMTSSAPLHPRWDSVMTAEDEVWR